MSAGATFGRRLREAVAARGPILAGIDPHPGVLAAWGLPDDASGLRALSRTVLAAVAGRVAAIKPQSAFFERHGSAGVAVLEELLGEARSLGVPSILDVKRGDIGSTMAGYAAAHLRPGAPLEADAITLSPYLGYGSLAPALDLAAEHGKGAFVLALTSNPEGAEVQHARDADGIPVARRIAEHAAAACPPAAASGPHPTSGDAAPAAGEWGSVGLVIGATTGDAVRELGIDLTAAPVPILSPGFGAQGAGPAELRAVFGAAAPRVLVAVSRGLLGAGPDPEALAREADALRRAYAEDEGASGPAGTAR